MTLAILPVIGLLLIILVSQPHDGHSKIPQKQPPSQGMKPVVQKKRPPSYIVQRKASLENNRLEDASLKKNLDYQSIIRYIQTRYKKIQKEDAENISKYLVRYGNMHQIDPKFAAALIARESSFNKEAVSQTGAKGLGQIKEFNYNSLSIDDPFNIKQNIQGTTQYLKRMLKKWEHRPSDNPSQPLAESEKIKLALASYYKGFTAVKTQGMDTKTNGYINDILRYYDAIKSTHASIKKQVPNNRP